MYINYVVRPIASVYQWRFQDKTFGWGWGRRGLCQREGGGGVGWGGGVRNSMKVLKVEVKLFF